VDSAEQPRGRTEPADELKAVSWWLPKKVVAITGCYEEERITSGPVSASCPLGSPPMRPASPAAMVMPPGVGPRTGGHGWAAGGGSGAAAAETRLTIRIPGNLATRVEAAGESERHVRQHLRHALL
jgi:hypothetical protein